MLFIVAFTALCIVFSQIGMFSSIIPALFPTLPYSSSIPCFLTCLIFF